MARTDLMNGLPPDSAGLGTSAILSRRMVPELQELVNLRRKGWADEGLDEHFQELQTSMDRPTEVIKSYWFSSNKSTIKALEAMAWIVPKMLKMEFLDLCCAPGGFSSYILGKNSRAHGVGISLPEQLGGNPFMLEHYFRGPRYDLIEHDILQYDLSPLGSPADARTPLQLPSALHGRFSLVLLHGFPLRTYTRAHPTDNTDDHEDDVMPRKMPRAAYRDCLLVAQLIIALKTVRAGGTIVLSLVHPECSPAAYILFLLDDLAERLTIAKPTNIGSSRASFFVIAKNVCGAVARDGADARRRRRNAYLAGLRRLWFELRFGGEHGSGRGLIPGDLDFIVTEEGILDGYLDRLVGLGRHVWTTQVEGLSELLRSKGVSE